MDGRLKVKLLDKTIVSITREDDVEKHIPGASEVLQRSTVKACYKGAGLNLIRKC